VAKNKIPLEEKGANRYAGGSSEFSSSTTACPATTTAGTLRSSGERSWFKKGGWHKSEGALISLVSKWSDSPFALYIKGERFNAAYSALGSEVRKPD